MSDEIENNKSVIMEETKEVTDTIESMSNPPVTLCKGGCCPVATFNQDSIIITDEDQTIVFTKEQVIEFVIQLYTKGYFQIIIS